MTAMALSHRERYLMACSHREPDRVPIDLQPCGNLKLPGVSRRLPLEKQIEAVREFGGDPLVDIWMPPEVPHPDVKVRKGHCGEDKDGCPLLFAEWQTPAGTLRSVVRQTIDWFDTEEHCLLENIEVGNAYRTDWDVHLFDNYNCVRYVEAPIKTMQDVESLKYLLNLPTGDDLQRWRLGAALCKRVAQENDLLLRARRTFAAGGLLWLMKPDDMLMATVTEPDLVNAAIDVLAGWQMKRLEAVLDIGVDIVMHASYYETSDYFGGSRWNQFCRPFIEKTAMICHQAGVQLTMQRSEQNTQQIEILRELPVDHVHGLEPGTGQEDMALLKREIGGRITLWGGVDTTGTVSTGSVEQIDAAVKEAIEICAPGGGFVIMPAAWTMCDVPIENVKAAIAAAIRYGIY
jgi:hypothetical protein